MPACGTLPLPAPTRRQELPAIPTPSPPCARVRGAALRPRAPSLSRNDHSPDRDRYHISTSFCVSCATEIQNIGPSFRKIGSLRPRVLHSEDVPQRRRGSPLWWRRYPAPPCGLMPAHAATEGGPVLSSSLARWGSLAAMLGACRASSGPDPDLPLVPRRLNMNLGRATTWSSWNCSWA
jgi:hypothetical protein